MRAKVRSRPRVKSAQVRKLTDQALIICTVTNIGFIGSGRFGSGVIVVRLPDGGWSAPSAVALGGLGVGGLIGIELTDFVFVLSTDEAVTKFMQSGCVHVGLNLSMALGMGRSGEYGGIAGSNGVSSFFSYSKTRGLFAGVSAQCGLVIERSRANKKIYERKLKTAQLATGEIPPPREAERLMRVLNSNGLRVQAKPPTPTAAALNPDSSGLQSLGREMPQQELADLSNLGPGLSEHESSEAHWSGLSSPGLTKPRHLNRAPRELQGDNIHNPESEAKPVEPSEVYELDPQQQQAAMLATNENLTRDASMRSSTVDSSHMSLQSTTVNTSERRDSSLLTSPGIPETDEKTEHSSEEQTEKNKTEQPAQTATA